VFFRSKMSIVFMLSSSKVSKRRTFSLSTFVFRSLSLSTLFWSRHFWQTFVVPSTDNLASYWSFKICSIWNKFYQNKLEYIQPSLVFICDHKGLPIEQSFSPLFILVRQVLVLLTNIRLG
jgi:hypothetical protein